MVKAELFGKKLKSPLIMASGVFGYGDEYDFIDLGPIAAFCTKGLSLKPRDGNPMPRIWETEAGIINSVGLQNIGVNRFLEEKLPKVSGLPMEIITNFFGNTVEEYVEAASILSGRKGIFALEMNISCPNVKSGGISFGQDPHTVEKLTKAVKKVVDKPLIVKLTPNVTSISDIALAAEAGGADSVSLINTVKAMAIDVKTGKPVISGGLSGRAIKPIALKAVYDVSRAVKIPVIGIGGIYTAEDVIEFIIAGAKAVQIGTAIFSNPNVAADIYRGLMDK
ncbi:MAG: dihydroorotate dehydrogenase [Oligoflexia bacterium]|nr:dihydroorotate dehydrogenase [Oligoflexia bacterium]